MRKTILAVIMVMMLTTPCLAQEIKPDGLFSLHGTRWQYFTPAIIVDMLPPPPAIGIVPTGGKIGFYQGDVYSCDKVCVSIGTYIDTPALGIYYLIDISEELIRLDLYVMQPTTGVGLTLTFLYWDTPLITRLGYGLGMMINVDNDWEPY